jgi:hypothetical protein
MSAKLKYFEVNMFEFASGIRLCARASHRRSNHCQAPDPR